MVTATTSRLAALDWAALHHSLSSRGYALTPPVLSRAACESLVDLYQDDRLFRSHIEMARYRFGEGDYKYFTRPLPPLVQELREDLYPRLAPVANAWMEQLGERTRFPATLAELLEQCAKQGQTRPTPLMLRYEEGDYNCLHQDLYGEVYFPLQVATFLSAPTVDYTGGELVLMEQRPRAQSAAEVIVPPQGSLVMFTTRFRPVKGARGFYRVNVRHGVSRVRSGLRYTLGIIFHDAK